MASSPPLEAEHCENGPEFYFRVAGWMREQRCVDAARIRERFNVSRATAYRWRRAWLDLVEGCEAGKAMAGKGGGA